MAKVNVKESTIQSAILSFLKVRRIMHNRINNGQFSAQTESSRVDRFGRTRRNSRVVRCNSLNGIPDIEVFAYIEKDGQSLIPVTIYLEVKSPTGRQSKHQKVFQERVDTANGYYFVVRSVTDVEDAFKSSNQKIKNLFGNECELKFLKAYTVSESTK